MNFADALSTRERLVGILSFRNALRVYWPLKVAFISPRKGKKGKSRWELNTRRETYLMLVKVYLRESEKLTQTLSIVARKTLTCFLS